MAPLQPPPLQPPPLKLTAAAPSADWRKEFGAASASLALGFFLLAMKFVAYFMTGSASVFSEAIESVANVFAAALTVYAVLLAHEPADRRHPYGHGKAEFITAAFEGGMLLAAGFVMVVRSIELLAWGAALQKLNLGLLLVGITAIISGTLGIAMIRRGKKVKSLPLEAVGHQFTSDAVTTVMVLLTLSLVRLTGLRWIDPVGGLAMAAYVSFIAASLMRRSFAGLMDEQDLADDSLIRRLIEHHIHAGVHAGDQAAAQAGDRSTGGTICSYHKLRHRHSGRYHWVDFHLVVPGEWSIEQGHRVASQIEREIEQALGDGTATAHVEPCHGIICPVCPAKPVEQISSKYPIQPPVPISS
jgi:cation diffusion facilitator family transporter